MVKFLDITEGKLHDLSDTEDETFSEIQVVKVVKVETKPRTVFMVDEIIDPDEDEAPEENTFEIVMAEDKRIKLTQKEF
jgi:hypothetical protein